jgi:hypothetical protein
MQRIFAGPSRREKRPGLSGLLSGPRTLVVPYAVPDKPARLTRRGTVVRRISDDPGYDGEMPRAARAIGAAETRPVMALPKAGPSTLEE